MLRMREGEKGADFPFFLLGKDSAETESHMFPEKRRGRLRRTRRWGAAVAIFIRKMKEIVRGSRGGNRKGVGL